MTKIHALPLLVALVLVGCSAASEDGTAPTPDAGTDGATASPDAGTPDDDGGSDAGPPARDLCAEAAAIRSYVGCEYFASPLAQIRELDAAVFDFRIVVANPSPEPALVTVHLGEQVEAQRTVVPGDLTVIPLPWIEGVSFPFGPGPWQSSVVADGAYRVTSSVPVIVSQYSPFHYSQDMNYSYTNDASLLLPTHALGEEHVAASYVPLTTDDPDYPGYPGWIAVVGVSETPTTVEVLAAGEIAEDAGGRWPAASKGERITFTVARGEVAQIAAAPPAPCGPGRPGFSEDHPICSEHGHDLTGSIVTSDAPVAVFSGHVCAYVPYDVAACDHLETQLAPVRTWGRAFETMPMREPGTEVGNLLRVVAARDGTRVTFDPPLRDGPQVELDAGEYVQTGISGATSITADGPIQVAQYLLGQRAVDPPLERGDPALTTLVPAEQFRTDYVFVIPSSYSDSPWGQSYVLVSRKPGEAVMIDGEQIEASWTPIGERELAIVPLRGGTHRASSTSPFGLMAYGLGSYTSYAHPAGLDLRILLE